MNFAPDRVNLIYNLLKLHCKERGLQSSKGYLCLPAVVRYGIEPEQDQFVQVDTLVTPERPSCHDITFLWMLGA